MHRNIQAGSSSKTQKTKKTPSPDPPVRQSSSSRRHIAAVACVPCKKRKSKCSGGVPHVQGCYSCLGRKIDCEWDMDEDDRSLTKMREKIQHLTQDINDLKSILIPLATTSNRREAAALAVEVAGNGFERVPAEQVRRTLTEPQISPLASTAEPAPMANMNLQPPTTSSNPTAYDMSVSGGQQMLHSAVESGWSPFTPSGQSSYYTTPTSRDPSLRVHGYFNHFSPDSYPNQQRSSPPGSGASWPTQYRTDYGSTGQ